MALNKSNKSTPSSRSGYFCETASTGKQNNFLFPVRIKVTPNTTVGSLSDGKNKHNKMLQPVLIKDLLQNNQKERQHSTIISVSTQKKKSSQRSMQPYLGRQSYYKPKKEEAEESTFFSRKYDGSKVRRQLYQTLEYSQKSVFDGKDNINKVIRPKKKITQDSEEQTFQSTLIQNKNVGSFLLPLNTIKNSFIRKSSSNLANTNKQCVKNNTGTKVNKQMKRASSIAKSRKLTNNAQKCVYTESQYEVDIGLDFSSSELNIQNKNQSCITVRDNCTMTSPSIDRKLSLSKSLSDISEFEKQLFTTNSSKLESEIKHSNNINFSCLEMQNLSICSEKPLNYNQPLKNAEFNLISMNSLNCRGYIELKSFLEQSIQACENQTLKLKQALNSVNNMFSNATRTNVQFNDNFEIHEKSNVSNTNSECRLNTTDIVCKSLEQKNATDNNSTLNTNTNEVKCTEESQIKAEEELSSSTKMLVSNEELNEEKKNSIEALHDLARLSTIGEVSCEVDELNKDDKDNSENKENINHFLIISPSSPKTPKSLPNISTEDSFILLENELNVKHNMLPSKSLPASPTKFSTHATFKQWDKKVERPLKEYMDLKMNGTFLVTPDVKRFQSCLESTDTPHSRKSLSRKIFMELCDLYAESPESK